MIAEPTFPLLFFSEKEPVSHPTEEQKDTYDKNPEEGVTGERFDLGDKLRVLLKEIEEEGQIEHRSRSRQYSGDNDIHPAIHDHSPQKATKRDTGIDFHRTAPPDLSEAGQDHIYGIIALHGEGGVTEELSLIPQGFQENRPAPPPEEVAERAKQRG